MVAPDAFNRRISRSAYLDHLRSQKVARREIAAVLMDAAKEAEDMVARLMGDQRVGAAVRRQQLQTIVGELRNQQEVIWRGVTTSTRSQMRAAARAAAQAQEELADYLVRAGASSQLRDQFVLAARSSAENVMSKYLNDIDLSPAVYRNQQRVIRQVQGQVARGIAQNHSAKEMAGTVRRFISPNVRGGVDYAAMRLARTEINNAFHATNVRTYAASPFVEAVKWELSSSHPRDDDCDDLADADEGLGSGIYRPTDVPSKPHPQCLCYTTTVTPSRERFQDTLLSGGYDSWLRSEGFAPIL